MDVIVENVCVAMCCSFLHILLGPPNTCTEYMYRSTTQTRVTSLCAIIGQSGYSISVSILINAISKVY